MQTTKTFKKALLPVLIIAALALLLIPLLALPVSAAEMEGYYTYTVSNGEATITDVDTAISGDVVIPSTLGGYPVTSIDYGAFHHTSIKRVSFEEGSRLEGIGSFAFYGCTSLVSITLPETVNEIGSDAFFVCSALQNMEIPFGVTYISEQTFKGCASLTTITIPVSVERIEDRAFGGCSSLTTVYYSGTKAQWEKIEYSNDPNNAPLFNANIVFETCAKHSWNDGEVIVAPTCAAEGEKTYTCTICGAIKTETVEKLAAHTWNSGEITVEPSCESSGIKTYICTVCGETKTETIDKLTTHTWNDGEITVEPSCEGSGVKTYICTVCDTEKTEPYGSPTHTWNSCGTACSQCGDRRIMYFGKEGYYNTLVNIPIIRDDGSVVCQGNFFPIAYVKTGQSFDYTNPQAAVLMDTQSSLWNAGNGIASSASQFSWTQKAHMVIHNFNANYFNEIGQICVTGTMSGGVRYVVSDAGMVNVSFTKLGNTAPYSAGIANFTYFVYVNGEKVFETRGADWTTNVQNNVSVINELTVQPGDIIDFICEGNVGEADPWGGAGNVLYAMVDYVNLDAHSWDSGKITTKPTSDSEGVRTYSCTDCGFKRTETIPVGGTCGENASWTFDAATGTLTISGAGEITTCAWRAYKDDIKIVVIEEGITAIGNSAFSSHTFLETASLPVSMINISHYSFEECTSLKTINFPPALEIIGYSAFSGCSAMTSIELPASLKTIDKYAFSRCSGLKNLVLPSTMTIIPATVFSSCTALESVVIPASVLTIDEYAFQYCSSLARVSFEEGSRLETICAHAFFSCSALTDIKIPVGTATIEGTAFQNCTGLVHIEIPDGITVISSALFRNCTSLKSIRIPLSVTSIESYAFMDTPSFAIVYYEGTRNQWNEVYISYMSNQSIKSAEVICKVCESCSWDEGVIISEPTCKEGSKFYTCGVCGATKTESISVLPLPDTYETSYSDTSNTPTADGDRVVFHGNWTAHVFPTGEYDYKYIGTIDWAGTTNNYKGIATSGGSAFLSWDNRNANYHGTIGTVGSNATESTLIRYTAEYSGLIDIFFDQLGNLAKNASGTFTYTVYRNGVRIWPLHGETNTVSGGCLLYDVKTKIVNDLFVREGDVIDFVCEGSFVVDGVNYLWGSGGNAMFATVEYSSFNRHVWNDGEITTEPTSLLEGTRTYTCTVCSAIATEKVAKIPTLSANVLLGDRFAANGKVTVPAGVTTTEAGLYVDGVKMTGVQSGGYFLVEGFLKTAAKEAGKTVTVQAYYVADGVEVKGNEITTSIAALLRTYLESDDAEVIALATATLNYAAAAQVYFGYDVENLVNEGLSETLPSGQYQDNFAVAIAKPDATVAPKEIALLLNDTVDLHVWIAARNGATVNFSRLSLVVSENADMSGALTVDFDARGVAIVKGISPANWNDTYYFRIVDGEGNAVSATFAYGVSTYFARMAENEDANLRALVASMMALYEANEAYLASDIEEPYVPEGNQTHPDDISGIF